MFLSTWPDAYRKLYSTNVTTGSYPALVPTNLEPNGDGIFQMNGPNEATNQAVVAFCGARSGADQTMTAKLTGWRKLGALWIPVPLLSLSITQGGATGVVGTDIIETNYFADTIIATTAYTSAYEIISPADDTVAVVKVDLFGCEKLQVQVAKGTNTSCNAIAAGF